MAQRRTSMKRIREALRLRYECGLSLRQTAKAVSVSRPVLTDYLAQCEKHNITYEKAQKMSDDEMLAYFKEKQDEDPRMTCVISKFPDFAKELTKVGVTRQLIWEEYIADNPEGYSYSQFCYHFRQWNDSQEMYMRIEHKAGDKLFVDFTGKKLEVIDLQTGEIKSPETFVATLGASKLIYVEAVWSQKKHDFISAQVNALNYIDGVPYAIVPDCLKSAVTKGHKYEPDINPEYQDFASYYGTSILAARPYKPRDKALVEGAVKIVYQRIFAPLRNCTFHTLEELNKAIKRQLEELNNKPMQMYKKSRWEMFNETDKKALLPLPDEPYSIRYFVKCKVEFNYHIYLRDDKHYYSVPYQYRGRKADVRYSARIVEIYLNNQRIAIHKRDRKHFAYTTVKAHMPPGHKFMDDWSVDKFLSWAGNVGEPVLEVVDTILCRKQHPEQGYKTCLGILNLAKQYGKERLNNACKRALYFEHLTYKMIKNILDNGLDSMQDKIEQDNQLEMFHHENIRGPEYYN